MWASRVSISWSANQSCAAKDDIRGLFCVASAGRTRAPHMNLLLMNFPSRTAIRGLVCSQNRLGMLHAPRAIENPVLHPRGQSPPAYDGSQMSCRENRRCLQDILKRHHHRMPITAHAMQSRASHTAGGDRPTWMPIQPLRALPVSAASPADSACPFSTHREFGRDGSSLRNPAGGEGDAVRRKRSHGRAGHGEHCQSIVPPGRSARETGRWYVSAQGPLRPGSSTRRR